MIELGDITKNTKKAKEFFKERLAFTLGPVELHRMAESEGDRIQIIDVRTSDDYHRGHIPEAMSIPLSNLEYSMENLSKDKINIVYCYDQQSHMAARAAGLLADEGFPVMELEGGFDSWSHKDYDIVTSG